MDTASATYGQLVLSGSHPQANSALQMGPHIQFTARFSAPVQSTPVSYGSRKTNVNGREDRKVVIAGRHTPTLEVHALSALCTTNKAAHVFHTKFKSLISQLRYCYCLLWRRSCFNRHDEASCSPSQSPRFVFTFVQPLLLQSSRLPSLHLH